MGGSELERRIYGGLVGGTVGDALCKASHRLPKEEIRRRFGRVTGLIDTTAPPCYANPRTLVISPSRWQRRVSEPVPVSGAVYTDVTKLKYILCDAIIASGGYVGASDLAAEWLANMNPFEFYYPVFSSYFKLHFGVATPRENGTGNIQSNSSAMAITPVGLVNPADPRQAALEAFDVASLIHTHYARDAACVIAAAVAACFSKHATVDTVVDAALAVIGSDHVLRKIAKKGLDAAREAKSEAELIDRLYQSVLSPLIEREVNPSDPNYVPIADPRESVPAVLSMFLFADGDPEQAILAAANFGRDTLAAGAMVGSLAGAFAGVEAIPQAWRDRVEAENPRQARTLADNLTRVVVQRSKETAARVERVRELAGFS